MGTDDLHPSHARAAERPAAGAGGHAGAGGPDLGARIRAISSASSPSRATTDLANDLWLQRRARRLSADAAIHGTPARERPDRRLCRNDPSRAVSAVARRSQGFRHDRAIDRDAGSGGAARRPAHCRCSSRGLDDLCARESRAHPASPAMSPSSGACDVVYVAPDVPTDDSGKSDLSVLDGLLDDRARQYPAARRWSCVLSQVPPGYTRARQRAGRAALLSGRDADFRPRGRARHRARALHRRLRRSGQAAAGGHGRVAAKLRLPDPADALRKRRAVQNRHQLLPGVVGHASPTRWPNSARRIGADWSEIVPALKLDRRIGAYAYLAPGLGIAGGNLERDLATVVRLADGIGSRCRRGQCLDRQQPAPQATGRSHTIKRRVLDRQPDATVAVWGLAYKENTAFDEEFAVARDNRRFARCEIVLHDPVVSASAVAHKGHGARPTRSRRSKAPTR